jgi:hypothetical protein
MERVTDDELLAAFEAGTPPQPFGHRQHVAVMWAYARRLPQDEALAAVDAGIRRLAGDSGKYHRTITVAWARIVSHVATRTATLDEALARHPWLADPTALSRHYSAELLASPEARATDVEPDLLPLP